MKVIDTHIHVWDLDKAKYDWLQGDTSIINRTFKIEEIETARLEQNVVAGVFVQSACNLEDTYLMFDIADKTDWIKGVVGWVPLMQPTKVEELLQNEFLKNHLFKGIRHLIHDEANSKWLLQSEVLESLALLANHNISFDVVGILPQHLACVIEVQNKIPNLKMVLDHLNAPPISKQERFGQWGELIKEVSTFKNVHAKISGLGTASGSYENRTTKDILPYVQYVVEYFGIERCFCGGDWPVSILSKDYASTWIQTKEIINAICTNDLEKEKILFSNAKTFYNLEIN